MTTTLSQYSQQQKKDARDLAIADLINSLKKLELNESLRFGNLGTFTKKERQITINTKLKAFKKASGKTYLYQCLNFRTSSLLKREIDK